MKIQTNSQRISLKRVNLLVTKKCNLHCRMCDCPLDADLSGQLSFDEIKSLLKDAADLGLEVVEISGGEAMIRRDIYDILSFAKSLNLKTHMMTNGVLIGDEQAEKLAEYGLERVTISLEGFENLNDKIRGQGSYRKAVGAIKCFQKFPDKIKMLEIGITLSRYNYRELYSFVRYLAEGLGIKVVSINPFHSSMLFEDNFEQRKTEFVISRELLQEVGDELEKVIAFAQVSDIVIPPEKYLRKMTEYFAGESMVPKSGCTEPLSACSIDSNGNIYPCWGDVALLGNIKKSSLKDIVGSGEYAEFCMRALKGQCRGCLIACNSEAHS